MDKRFALLIDAENTSVKYLDHIFKELREYGSVTYKRMYGDFTEESLSTWNKKALDYAIVPIQQPRYSKAKNAADIMLVIDAMDILYGNNVDGFCIVSSDSDFTRLVNRLSENGMMVIGMGKSNASKTLKAACTEFKNLEKIFDDELLEKTEFVEETEKGGSKDNKAESNNITPLSEIKQIMLEIVQQKENKGEKAGLGGIKSQLQKAYTDFDERNYGYTSMTTFVKDMKEFELKQEGCSVYVLNNKQGYNREEIEQFILDSVKKSSLDLGTLSRRVYDKYEGFSYKELGYSQFVRFVSSIPHLSIEDKSNTQKTVKYKK